VFLGVIEVFFASFSGLSFFALGVAVGPLQSPVEKPSCSDQAEHEPKGREPSAPVKLLVEPLPDEESNDDAQSNFETNCRVGPGGFPVLLHSYQRDRGCRYHAGRRRVKPIGPLPRLEPCARA